MACTGCQQSSPQADQIRRARATMCHVCLWAKRARGQKRLWTSVGCTVSGKPVEHHVRSCAPSCPKNMHPDRAGMVRWMGMEWMGVPRFIRWIVRPSKPLPGCGCHARAKRLWLYIRAKLARTNIKGIAHAHR